VAGLVAVTLTLGILFPNRAHALAVALVQVANTPANPIPNQDVDQPGRHPFQQQCSGVMQCNITAPVGQRLVLQYINARLIGEPLGPVPSCGVFIVGTGGSADAWLPCISVSGAPAIFAHTPLTMYVDPGGTATVSAFTSASSTTFEALVTGYTITP
jgi:hypothetical protein